jgi:hypothetical protein
MTLFVDLNLVAGPNLAQLTWFNLFLALCLSWFVGLNSVTWPDLAQMVQPVPGTVQDAKQDATCFDMFVLVCGSKMGNWAKSCSIEMAQPVPATVQDAKQDATCCVVFVFVCCSIFSKMTRSCSIDMVYGFLCSHKTHSYSPVVGINSVCNI